MIRVVDLIIIKRKLVAIIFCIVDFILFKNFYKYELLKTRK